MELKASSSPLPSSCTGPAGVLLQRQAAPCPPPPVTCADVAPWSSWLCAPPGPA